MEHNGSTHTGRCLNDEITARIRLAAHGCTGPGDRVWTVAQVVAVADALGVDPVWLTLGTGSAARTPELDVARQ